MVLHDGRRILTVLAARQGTQYVFAVLATAEIVPVRPQLGGKLAGQFKHVSAHDQIAAAWYRAGLGRDGPRRIALVVARNRQRIDAVGAVVVHPGRLAAIPIRQDPSAVQASLRPSRSGLFDGCQIVLVHPVVVIHQGNEFGFDGRDGGIQRMGFPGCGYVEHLQRQTVFGRLASLVRLHLRHGIVTAGIGRHQDVHGHGGAARPVERRQGFCSRSARLWVQMRMVSAVTRVPVGYVSRNGSAPCYADGRRLSRRAQAVCPA